MRKLAIGFFGLLGISALFAGAFFIILPLKEVNRLRVGEYVEVLGQKSQDGDEFDYQLTSKRPESWRSLDEISPYLQGSVIASEDWSFYEHSGVDFTQLRDALVDAFKSKRVRGASTITQQVVKNLFLNHRSTLERKIREVVIALYLERQLSKDQIIEIYLNIAHWGAERSNETNENGVKSNFYGVAHAAKFYFEKGPMELNARESAFLAALLPSPVRYSGSFFNGELSQFMRQRIYTIVDSMRIKGYIDRDQMDYHLAQHFSWESKDDSLRPFVLGVDLKATRFFKREGENREWKESNSNFSIIDI